MTESEQSKLAITLKSLFYLKMHVFLPFLQIPGHRICIILILVIVKRKMTDRYTLKPETQLTLYRCEILMCLLIFLHKRTF